MPKDRRTFFRIFQQTIMLIRAWPKNMVCQCLCTSKVYKHERIWQLSITLTYTLPSSMPLPCDLLHPSADEERAKHKLKRLVQHPNSYFMSVKCPSPSCSRIATVFSHSQTVVLCTGCQAVLCQSTGGRARLTEGCKFRKMKPTDYSFQWKLQHLNL